MLLYRLAGGFSSLGRGARRKEIVKHGFRALLPGRLVSHAVPTTDGVPDSGLCRGRAVQGKAVGCHCSIPNARRLASCSFKGISGLPCFLASIFPLRLARIFAHQSAPSSQRSSNVFVHSGSASASACAVSPRRNSSQCAQMSATVGK